jgi:hypothetical protein
VVVELFTSQGCSSCPPADRLLAELVEEFSDEPRVLALSFHVDYWNSLGWRDPFSSARHSRRQQAYARALGGGVYTPQMIVSGTEAFVGSRAGRARAAIAKAFRATSQARLGLWLNEDRTVGYRVGGTTGDSNLNLALVQANATLRVVSGENAGHTLTHINVVRDFEERELVQSTGTWQPNLPADEQGNDFAIIAFVQRKTTHEIETAHRIALSCIPGSGMP